MLNINAVSCSNLKFIYNLSLWLLDADNMLKISGDEMKFFLSIFSYIVPVNLTGAIIFEILTTV